MTGHRCSEPDSAEARLGHQILLSTGYHSRRVSGRFCGNEALLADVGRCRSSQLLSPKLV